MASSRCHWFGCISTPDLPIFAHLVVLKFEIGAIDQKSRPHTFPTRKVRQQQSADHLNFNLQPSTFLLCPISLERLMLSNALPVFKVNSTESVNVQPLTWPYICSQQAGDWEHDPRWTYSWQSPADPIKKITLCIDFARGDNPLLQYPPVVALVLHLYWMSHEQYELLKLLFTLVVLAELFAWQ